MSHPPVHRLIFIGPQGSGKSTQAQIWAAQLNVPRLCSGELIRQEMSLGTEMGLRVTTLMHEGQLLSDEDVEHLLFSKLAAAHAHGWILDGYPRRVSQARKLWQHFLPTRIIEFAVPDEICIARLTQRRVCAKNHIYHLTNTPPQVDGICDVDGLPLTQRDDDKPKAITERLKQYHRETEPALRWMQQQERPSLWHTPCD